MILKCETPFNKQKEIMKTILALFSQRVKGSSPFVIQQWFIMEMMLVGVDDTY